MSEPVSYLSANATPLPNRIALWAMILGILAFVLSFVVIGGLLGLVALILGIIGAVKPGRKGMAITGIVTGVLSLPIALLAMPFWILLVFAATTTPMRMARVRTLTVQAEMANLKSALYAFEVDNGRFPTTAEGLRALVVCPPGLEGTWHKAMDDLPTDSWGNGFIYLGPDQIPDKERFNILSTGPDGKLGNADDIDIHTAP